MDNVLVSDSPHIRGPKTTKGIMIDVCISLLPACLAGCILFGWAALGVLLITSFTCVATEIVYSLCQKKSFKKIMINFDFTSLVTGLLLGMTFAPGIIKQWWVPIISSIFAIAVVKMLFGGTGKNIVNPAITGRVFAFIAFQAAVIGSVVNPIYGPIKEVSSEIISTATPLTNMLQNGIENLNISLLDLFLGTGVGGTIGETCKLALLVGGIYLVVRKVIDWKWPTIYILTTGLFAVVLNKFNFHYFLPSILSGGLMMGAIFMATDYVTSPSSSKGCYVYYVALGIVTALLRHATGIEVVSFAILLMNLFVPIINTYIKPRIFGAPTFIEKCKAKAAANKAKKEEKAKAKAAQAEAQPENKEVK